MNTKKLLDLMKLNNKCHYIKLCLYDYIIYSITNVFIYIFVSRILAQGIWNFFEFLKFKDMLIIPLSPIAILFVEGIPYFLIFNLFLLMFFPFKFKNPLRKYVISTICSHSINFIILFATDYHIYRYITMPNDDVIMNKIIVGIFGLLVAISIIWLLFHKKN